MCVNLSCVQLPHLLVDIATHSNLIMYMQNAPHPYMLSVCLLLNMLCISMHNIVFQLVLHVSIAT